MKVLLVPRELTYALWDQSSGNWSEVVLLGEYSHNTTSPRDPLWEELRSVAEILSLVDPGRWNKALEVMRTWEKSVEKFGKWTAGPSRSAPIME